MVGLQQEHGVFSRVKVSITGNCGIPAT